MCSSRQLPEGSSRRPPINHQTSTCVALRGRVGRACSWILVAALGLGVAFSAPVSAGRTDPFPHVGQRPEGERIGGESGDFSASSGSRYIIRATDPPALDRVVALLVELGITPLDQWRDNLAGLVARLDPSTVAELRSNPDVASIERDRPMEATSEQGLSLIHI